MRNILLILLFSLFFVACTDQRQKPKELLVYCGTTMAKPLSEIATEFEKSAHCKVAIIVGLSGDLYQSILTNEVGDLYLSGSEFYITEAMNRTIIKDTVNVGVNKPVIMFRKDSKDKITRTDACFLLNKKICVVIANPYSSIGKVTQKILEKRGIYDKVVSQISFFAADSKDLMKMLKEDKADLAINWYAPYVWDDNKDFVSCIPMDSINENHVILSTLTYSKQPELADLFLAQVASDDGKKVFKKYGL